MLSNKLHPLQLSVTYIVHVFYFYLLQSLLICLLFIRDILNTSTALRECNLNFFACFQ